MTLRLRLLAVAFAACAAPAVAALTLSFSAIEPSAPGFAPQVFVRDSSAPAQTDDRGPVNVAGFRRVRADDDPNVELFNANGSSLLVTLEKWRAGNGTVVVSTEKNGTQAMMAFRRLVAFGRYSLFARLQSDDGVRLVPLDGTGAANSFSADDRGNATANVPLPQAPAPGVQVVVIYHSDGTDHGEVPGDFGRSAHQQLVVRLP